MLRECLSLCITERDPVCLPVSFAAAALQLRILCLDVLKDSVANCFASTRSRQARKSGPFAVSTSPTLPTTSSSSSSSSKDWLVPLVLFLIEGLAAFEPRALSFQQFHAEGIHGVSQKDFEKARVSLSQTGRAATMLKDIVCLILLSLFLSPFLLLSPFLSPLPDVKRLPAVCLCRCIRLALSPAAAGGAAAAVVAAAALSPSLLFLLLLLLLQVRQMDLDAVGPLIPPLVQKLRGSVGVASRCGVSFFISWLFAEWGSKIPDVSIHSKRLLRAFARSLLDPSPAVRGAAIEAFAAICKFTDPKAMQEVANPPYAAAAAAVASSSSSQQQQQLLLLLLCRYTWYRDFNDLPSLLQQ